MRRQLCIIIVNDASDKFSVLDINILLIFGFTFWWISFISRDSYAFTICMMPRKASYKDLTRFEWNIAAISSLDQFLSILFFIFHFKVIITICNNLMIESIHWKPKYNDFNISVINKYDGEGYKETTCIFFI